MDGGLSELQSTDPALARSVVSVPHQASLPFLGLGPKPGAPRAHYPCDCYGAPTLLRDDVDPIVRCFEAARWEGTGSSVGVDTVAAARRAGQSCQRAVGMGSGEVVFVDGIKPVRVVRNDIGCPCRERHRAREVSLLPTTGGFIWEGGGTEQLTRGTPKVSRVRACVLRTLVETDSYGMAGCGRLKLDAKLHRVGIVCGYDGRRIASVEQGLVGRAYKYDVDPVVGRVEAEGRENR